MVLKNSLLNKIVFKQLILKYLTYLTERTKKLSTVLSTNFHLTRFLPLILTIESHHLTTSANSHPWRKMADREENFLSLEINSKNAFIGENSSFCENYSAINQGKKWMKSLLTYTKLGFEFNFVCKQIAFFTSNSICEIIRSILNRFAQTPLTSIPLPMTKRMKSQKAQDDEL